MSPRFFETGYGRTFYEGQLPALIKVLDRIATALEALAKQSERKEAVK